MAFLVWPSVHLSTILSRVNFRSPHARRLALALGWALATAAQSADWPMFRGSPALTGVAPGALPAQPKLLWTFKTQGR